MRHTCESTQFRTLRCIYACRPKGSLLHVTSVSRRQVTAGNDLADEQEAKAAQAPAGGPFSVTKFFMSSTCSSAGSFRKRLIDRDQGWRSPFVDDNDLAIHAILGRPKAGQGLGLHGRHRQRSNSMLSLSSSRHLSPSRRLGTSRYLDSTRLSGETSLGSGNRSSLSLRVAAEVADQSDHDVTLASSVAERMAAEVRTK